MLLGGDWCRCCGQNRIEALQFDHPNNDGYKERPKDKRGTYDYSRALAEQVYAGRRDLQVLCANCNYMKKSNGGICPHEEERMAHALLVA